MDYSRIKLLSFDCYGTLIHWRKSEADILEPFFRNLKVAPGRDELYKVFLNADRRLTGAAYKPYREILAENVEQMAAELNTSLPLGS
jgi:FMN phosphatase YigB (HAD superfamily)